jgi:hypothetical protein
MIYFAGDKLTIGHTGELMYLIPDPLVLQLKE